jgi:hypothetical protein
LNGSSVSPWHSGAAIPVAWTGEPAATIAIGRPPGGGPPIASSRATTPRVSVPKNCSAAGRSSTNTPRRPELPPEVSAM